MPGPNIQALFDALFEEKIAAALAADAVTDEAAIEAVRAECAEQIRAALAADAAADAEAFAQKDATIVILRSDVSAAQQKNTAQASEIAALKHDIGRAMDANTALLSEIDALKARIAQLEAGAPPIPPDEPEPDPVPNPPATGVPSVAAFKALTTDAARTAYLAQAEAWFKANKGATGTLTAYTGSTTVTKAGTVIENKTIKGPLNITGANVTVKNCVINGGGYWGVDASAATGFKLLNCTVNGARTKNYNNAVMSGNDSVVKDCLINGHQHGIVPQGGTHEITGNYIADGYMPDQDAHIGGISIKGGSQQSIVATGNFVRGLDTSCCFIDDDFGWVKDTRVEGNFFRNQSASQKTAYPAYSFDRNRAKGWGVYGTKYLANVLEKGAYGYFSINGDCVMTGNVDAKTGAVVDGK